ncbi:DUF1820 family protein [Aquisalimonas lutea]|uniref:DUF1820 family protein n=1 Tax=Aquisalimonas lutea TaxID=1327750 RepID=UPI0025B46EEE|nr:DUF1820 family protein [Aquisalimonas lutea]MDN3518330.1 DUF1820 family protein [Aquisalimonas lutea]
MAEERIYRIIFFNQGQVYEIYARSVQQGAMMGFVEVESLSFGERTRVVVDPAEERLQSEFEGVRRTYIPMHSVVRIDEVERVGASKVTDASGKVMPFPNPPGYGPGGGSE